MNKIGVIGASGQVGSEIVLLLKRMFGYEVIPICRSRYSAIFFEELDFKCRIGNIENKDDSVKLLEDIDLVIDFSLPKGLPSEINFKSKKIIENIVRYSKHDSKFIYISSIMAFGMGKDKKELKNYFLANTSYGSCKRYAEKLVIKLCKKSNKKYYILRLGQVHGILQNISSIIQKSLPLKEIFIPDSKSFTIFTPEIAQAIFNIDSNKVKSDIYTLISYPDWQWKEVFNYYLNQNTKINLLKKTYPSSLSDEIIGLIKRNIISIIKTNKDLITSYISNKLPSLEKKLLYIYYVNSSNNQILTFENKSTYNFSGEITVYSIPGKRLTSIKLSGNQIRTVLDTLEEYLTNNL